MYLRIQNENDSVTRKLVCLGSKHKKGTINIKERYGKNIENIAKHMNRYNGTLELNFSIIVVMLLM